MEKFQPKQLVCPLLQTLRSRKESWAPESVGKVLKVKYSDEEDILTYQVSDEPIDYADEMDSVIVHFARSGKPVLLEILDASKFLSQAAKATRKFSNLRH